jgi:hypothetical protein
MSIGIIALLCVVCLAPLWAAASIVRFALGTCRCGVLLDPYHEGGDSGGKRDRCPVNPQGPRDDGGVEGPEDRGPGGGKADWWPQFERDLGRYVEERRSCPVRPRSNVDRADRELTGPERAPERH